MQQFQIYSMYNTAIQNNQFLSNINKITHLVRTDFQGHNWGGILVNELNKDVGVLLKANVHVVVTEQLLGLHFLT